MNHSVANDMIVEEITIRAPAERVFGALTNPEERIRWWGAEGRFKTTHAESDLRPGGKWLMRGIGLGGRPFTVQGVYREIDRPRLLVFTWLPSWQDDPTETLVSFDLIEKDGVTTVCLTHSGLATESSRAQHRGWPDILAWLKSYSEKH
ncbi:MAG TPA: SRPBCC domain-containing protein [Steroidobacteraceae bacterium]|nr:SRPBCC domain-containing protein [Steroidobacteraceae bacterium]